MGKEKKNPKNPYKITREVLPSLQPPPKTSKIHKPLCLLFADVYFGLFKHICQIYCVCANQNPVSWGMKLLEAMGSLENEHDTLWSREISLIYILSLNFRILNLKNIKFQSQSVLCVYLHMHAFLR